MKEFIAEFLGTAFLLMIVVGSGIMGENLAGGNVAIALLANSLATGFGLYILILALGPISGADFNPAVTLFKSFMKKTSKKKMTQYMVAQISGGIFGVLLTHIMFAQDVLQISTKNRFAPSLWVSEFIATFGLIAVIYLVNKKNSAQVAAAVGSYITAAYWFTSSTSFANPAVTIARSLTNTFCGIAPSGVAPFIGAQLLAVIIIYLVFKKDSAQH